jgi:pimeloyl-ACP methyl ester carboxylesterase
MQWQLVIAIGVSSLAGSLLAQPPQETTAITPGRQRIVVRSTRDGSLQPSYLIVPATYQATGDPVALVVSLHTWSFDLEQRLPSVEAEAARRNWIYLFPNFRGADDHPEACASELAQQDVLDAVAWARTHLTTDARRIYLFGWSGGGHMALVMAARAPQLWAAVSAWAPISDLAIWHRERAHDPSPTLARQIVSCVGGAPGESATIDAQYRERSPIATLHRAANVPIDLWAGRRDGHAPPAHDVSIGHALVAFNAIAGALGAPAVSAAEMQQLSRLDGRLADPRPGDETRDPAINRDVFLRRTAGPSRVTVYDGGHEMFAGAAFTWFDAHAKH